MRQAQALLDEPQLDAAVRVGDVYAVLIEHYTQSGDFKQVSYWQQTLDCHLLTTPNTGHVTDG